MPALRADANRLNRDPPKRGSLLPVPIAADVVVAVRYGKWEAAWLPNEPYKDDYLVVFDPCRWKHNAWPLRGNINTPN